MVIQNAEPWDDGKILKEGMKSFYTRLLWVQRERWENGTYALFKTYYLIVFQNLKQN